MRIERLSYDERDLVSRLERDRHFALDYLEAALRTGEGSEICLTFAHLALALDGVALPPEAIDPEEARFVLERLRAVFKLETREILLV
jgi:hypothetical protein